MENQRIIAVVLSLFIFLYSLTQETFYIDNLNNPYAWANGFINLAMGWASGNGSWFANIILVAAWATTQKKSLYPIILSIMAFIVGFGFFFKGNIISDSAGTKSNVTHYLIGYWTWLSSMVAYLLYHLYIMFKEKRMNEI